jgi:hypothetical protein
VNILIMQRFDVAAANGPPSPVATVNGVKTEPSHTATSNGKRPSPATDSSSASSPRPAKKQHRSQPSMEDLDAAYAARLQAEENGRARTTRGGAKGGSAGGSKKGSPAKREGKPKKRKSKSKAKVESGEESDADGERKEEKERKGGFHVSFAAELARLLTRQKPMLLSTPLAELLGEQTVRHLRASVRKLTVAALPPADGQAAVGVHQGARPAGPERQAADCVRRAAAQRVQDGARAHVHDEPDPEPEPVRCGRVMNCLACSALAVQALRVSRALHSGAFCLISATDGLAASK